MNVRLFALSLALGITPLFNTASFLTTDEVTGQVDEAEEATSSYTRISFETYEADNEDMFYDMEVLQGKEFWNHSAAPIKEGMVFKGWYLDESYTTPFVDGSLMSEDEVVLYAKYEKEPNTYMYGYYDLSKNDGFYYQSQTRPTKSDGTDVYAWMGCETAVLQTILKSNGYAPDVTYKDLLDNVPRTTTNNPYLGFAGSLYTNSPLVDGMMPNVFTAWANNYATANDISKQGIEPLIHALSEGHMVAVWLSSLMRPSKVIWSDNRELSYFACTYSSVCREGSWRVATDPMNGRKDYQSYYDHPTSPVNGIDPATGQILNYHGSTPTRWEYKTWTHVMTLVGYNGKTKEFLLADPAENINLGKVKYRGTLSLYWVSEKVFMDSWYCYQGAVEVY